MVKRRTGSVQCGSRLRSRAADLASIVALRKRRAMGDPGGDAVTPRLRASRASRAVSIPLFQGASSRFAVAANHDDASTLAVGGEGGGRLVPWGSAGSVAPARF